MTITVIVWRPQCSMVDVSCRNRSILWVVSPAHSALVWLPVLACSTTLRSTVHGPGIMLYTKAALCNVRNLDKTNTYYRDMLWYTHAYWEYLGRVKWPVRNRSKGHVLVPCYSGLIAQGRGKQHLLDPKQHHLWTDSKDNLLASVEIVIWWIQW